MGDYNFGGLNPRDFEQFTQALLKKIVAPGIRPYGDGADGAREATFEGLMENPTSADRWNGYLVVQCKFRKVVARDTKKDGQWAISQINADMAKFADSTKGLRRPDYYLFVTNVALTAQSETGSKDKVLAALAGHAQTIGIKEFDVWSYG